MSILLFVVLNLTLCFIGWYIVNISEDLRRIAEAIEKDRE